MKNQRTKTGIIARKLQEKDFVAALLKNNIKINEETKAVTLHTEQTVGLHLWRKIDFLVNHQKYTRSVEEKNSLKTRTTYSSKKKIMA